MTYVCSDLHGYKFEGFMELLEKVSFSQKDELYVIGDVVDRGKDGVKLLKWMMAQKNVHLILGNHEAMLLACASFLFDDADCDTTSLTGTNRSLFATWMSNSGRPTYEALSVMRSSEVRYILEYLKKAPLYECITVNDREFVLVHGGLGNFRSEKPLSEYAITDLLWTRPNIYLDYYRDKTTIFGHTPTVFLKESSKGRALVTETWVDIDAGCALGLDPVLLRLDDMKQFYLD
jgi:serine/threonine protein phosphatase 1